MTRMGYAPKIISTVKVLHTDVKVRVSISGELPAPITYNSAVKQGSVLAPTLFTILIAAMYEHAFLGCSDGVWFHLGSDENLFICHDHAHIASVLRLSTNSSMLMIVL